MKKKRNPTDKLPELSSTEIALMTKEEFLEYRDPQHKYHEPDSYDFDLDDLNKNYDLQHQEVVRTAEGSFNVYKSKQGYAIYFAADSGYSHSYKDEKNKLVAIIHGDTLYYSNPSMRHRLPSGYLTGEGATFQTKKDVWVPFPYHEEKRVKYLEDLFKALIDKVKERNLHGYPYFYQRILVGDDYYEIRFEQPPVIDKGMTIVVLNVEGQVVAQATDEWGATLLTVAEEYRGRGLGKIIGEIWYQWNPTYPSGGFTTAGRANAIALWEKRVRDFLSKGWYSELIKNKHLTKSRLSEITRGLSKDKTPAKPSVVAKQEKNPLFFIEKEQGYWGPVFVVYDEDFLREPDPKYIYGFGFFRDATPGTILYAIDYEKNFEKLTTYIALQMAKNNKEKIYVGENYGDLLELDGLKHVRVKNGYATLTKDVVDLDLIRQPELIMRRRLDPHGEKYNTLLEMAHSKWDV